MIFAKNSRHIHPIASTHPNPQDQQTAQTSAFIEVLTLANDQQPTAFDQQHVAIRNSLESSKCILNFL